MGRLPPRLYQGCSWLRSLGGEASTEAVTGLLLLLLLVFLLL
jgi:hypothetical protein